jgi:WD40 repeat protein
MLWDIRRNMDTVKPEPIAELDGHTGPVTLLHMDQCKIVTGGPEDSFINVWEADNGSQTNSLICGPPEKVSGCSALAVNGNSIVTASFGEQHGVLRFRDFTNASCPVAKPEDEHASKFWDPQSYSDSNGSDC